jgi:hypothetical protein
VFVENVGWMEGVLSELWCECGLKDLTVNEVKWENLLFGGDGGGGVATLVVRFFW